MKFYELTQNYINLMDLFEDMDQQTFNDTLESIIEPIEQKAENIVKLAKLNDSEVDAIESEIKRLTDRKKVLENKSNRLTQYLYHHMTTAGIQKLKSPIFTISIVKNAPKLQILDEEKIPSFYFKQKVEHVLDKKDLLKDLKEGQEIEGATIIQETRLSVK